MVGIRKHTVFVSDNLKPGQNDNIGFRLLRVALHAWLNSQMPLKIVLSYRVGVCQWSPSLWQLPLHPQSHRADRRQSRCKHRRCQCLKKRSTTMARMTALNARAPAAQERRRCAHAAARPHVSLTAVWPHAYGDTRGPVCTATGGVPVRAAMARIKRGVTNRGMEPAADRSPPISNSR